MVYNECPHCGAPKHYLKACPACGYSRRAAAAAVAGLAENVMDRPGGRPEPGTTARARGPSAKRNPPKQAAMRTGHKARKEGEGKPAPKKSVRSPARPRRSSPTAGQERPSVAGPAVASVKSIPRAVLKALTAAVDRLAHQSGDPQRGTSLASDALAARFRDLVNQLAGQDTNKLVVAFATFAREGPPHRKYLVSILQALQEIPPKAAGIVPPAFVHAPEPKDRPEKFLPGTCWICGRPSMLGDNVCYQCKSE